MPCASCCGSQADERSSFAEPSCRAHGLCSGHGWRPAAVQNGGRCGGAGDGPLAERIAGFLLNGYFFRCAHSLRRADRSVVWTLSFTPLSRAYPFLACIRAHASAWLPRFCRTVAIRLVIGIVLIWCGLFFIAG